MSSSSFLLLRALSQVLPEVLTLFSLVLRHPPVPVNLSLMPFFTLSLSKCLSHSDCRIWLSDCLGLLSSIGFWHYLKISLCKSCIWAASRFIIIVTAQTVRPVPLLSLKQLLHFHPCSFPSILSFLM